MKHPSIQLSYPSFHGQLFSLKITAHILLNVNHIYLPNINNLLEHVYTLKFWLAAHLTWIYLTY